MSEFNYCPTYAVEDFVASYVKEAEFKSAEEWLCRLYERVAPALCSLCRLDKTPVATAFVVDKSGILASDFNAVEALDRRQGLVQFTNGQSYKVTLLAFDVRADVSLFKIVDPFVSGCSFRALPLARASANKSNAIACVSLVPGDKPCVSAGLLRGIKFDKRVEMICRLSGLSASFGSPIFNRQGRVTGIFNHRRTGLDKAAGAEHLHALLKALHGAELPPDGVLKIFTKVGSDHVSLRSLHHDVPPTLLREEFERMRLDGNYKRKVDQMFAVTVEQKAIL